MLLTCRGAAISGDIRKMESLLNKGADVNGKDSSGYTALHYAARSGNVDICKLLLRNRASANVSTLAGGVTPLHRAAYMGRTQVVQMLIDSGANVNLVDNDGNTALHKAVLKDQAQVVELLLRAGVSLGMYKNSCK
eukprot:TRINITY_DN1743_c0_g1_i5.p1 TRINITY_DN1743_c0_g1~~TRINITY_DN1743_c0_g1_i5.p1  ORF type:complete len:136 (-),score=18.03 TRINITY_DN1743_c0_g1_i5:39-446(-)